MEEKIKVNSESLQDVLDRMRDEMERFNSVIDTLVDEACKINENTTEPECPFKEGDRVLVRDFNFNLWVYGVFGRQSDDGTSGFVLRGGFHVWKQCIPYNEDTWKLLGTAIEPKGGKT